MAASAEATRYVTRPKIVFSGKDGEQFDIYWFDLETELTVLNLLEQINPDECDKHTPEKQRKAFSEIARTLQGAAKELALTLQDDRDPGKLMKLLRDEYARSDPQYMTRMRNKLNTYEWADGGGSARGLQRYIRGLNRQLAKGPSGEVAAMSLRDRLYTVVPAKYHIPLAPLIRDGGTTLDEAFDEMTIWEGAFGKDEGVEDEGAPTRSALKATREGRRDTTRVSRDPPDVVCWNCARRGHKSNQCRDSPATCKGCNGKGHLARFCKKTPGATGRRGTKGREARSTYFALTSMPPTHWNDVGNDPVLEATSEDSSPNPGDTETGGHEGDALLSDKGKDQSNMVVDSGASDHMSANREWFSNLRLVDGESVRIASGRNLQVVGRGTILFRVMEEGGREITLALQDAQYVPEMPSFINLFSTGAATKQGAKVILEHGGNSLLLPDGSKIRLTQQGNMVTMEGRPGGNGNPEDAAALHANRETREEKQLQLHRRLGHLSAEKMREMKGHTQGVDEDLLPEAGERINCDICIQAKITAGPREKGPAQRESDTGERIIHADIIGPSTPSKVGKFTHAVVFLDESTRVAGAYPLKNKREAVVMLKRFVADTATDPNLTLRYGEGVHTLQTDHESVFGSQHAKEEMRKQGFKLRQSEPYRHWRNGLVERVIRTLKERVTVMLEGAELGKEYWVAALNHACHLYNRTPHSALPGGVSPFERATENRPDLTREQVFGAECVILTDSSRRRKGDMRGERGLYLGEDRHSQGRLVFVPATGAVRVSADVKVLPGRRRVDRPQGLEEAGDENSGQLPGGVTPGTTTSGTPPGVGAPGTDALSPDTEPPPVSEGPTTEGADEGPTDVSPTPSEEDSLADDVFEIDHVVNHRMTKGGTELRLRWKGYTHREDTYRLMKELQQELDGEIYNKMMQHYEDRKGEKVTDDEAGAAMTAQALPRTMEEARSREDADQWESALDREIQQHLSRGVYEVVRKQDIPGGANIVPMREVLSIKYAADGTVDKFKVRLCVRGDREKWWAKPTDTSSPVLAADTLRLLCAITSTKPEWVVWQVDYTQAYTNANLPEDREVFVQFPVGIMGSTRDQPQMAKLHKALYGLADAGREWYRKLAKQLQDFGMERSADDLCLFTLREGDEPDQVTAIVVVWVDDMLVCGTPSSTQKLLKYLEGECPLSKGPPSTFLGIRVVRQEGSGQINLDQAKYIEDTLLKYGAVDCKVRKIPAVDNPALHIKADRDGEVPEGQRERTEQYREILGTLLHLAVWTRPDLSFIMGVLARHCSNPTEYHLSTARGILRYLRGTTDNCLRFGQMNRDDQLMAYCDANYAGDRTTAKSTSAYVVLLNGAAVSYHSKLQTVVAQSTTEAEVIALAECIRAVIALRNKLESMGMRQKPETVINVDNQTAIHLAHRPTNGPRSKHFAVRLQFLREHVARKTIRVVYVPTHLNISDLLTKLLERNKTKTFRDMMCGKEHLQDN